MTDPSKSTALSFALGPVLYAPGTAAAREGTAEADVCLDIGRVLMQTEEKPDVASIPGRSPVPGARQGVKELIAAFGRDRVHVVSRCSEAAEVPLLQWLVSAGIVGDEPDELISGNVHFCRERAGKGPILERLRAKVHVDDRAEVMAGTRGVPSLLLRVLFNPRQEELSHPGLAGLDGLVIESDWRTLPGLVSRELAMRL